MLYRFNVRIVQVRVRGKVSANGYRVYATWQKRGHWRRVEEVGKSFHYPIITSVRCASTRSKKQWSVCGMFKVHEDVAAGAVVQIHSEIGTRSSSHPLPPTTELLTSLLQPPFQQRCSLYIPPLLSPSSSHSFRLCQLTDM